MRAHIRYLISLMGRHKNGGKNNTCLLLACRSLLFEYAHNLYTTSFSKFLTAVFAHMGTPFPTNTPLYLPLPLWPLSCTVKNKYFFVNICSFDCPLPSRYLTHVLLSIPSRHRRRAKISPLCSPVQKPLVTGGKCRPTSLSPYLPCVASGRATWVPGVTLWSS